MPSFINTNRLPRAGFLLNDNNDVRVNSLKVDVDSTNTNNILSRSGINILNRTPTESTYQLLTLTSDEDGTHKIIKNETDYTHNVVVSNGSSNVDTLSIPANTTLCV